MKTFKTSGTGSGQSLSEIESERIPVYQTVADAEADLNNLEEGQIVMTPDEGAEELLHPVAVVEKDNTHAVQSGAVANALSYSTTEQRTGGTWIDGKPIYRKTVTFSTNTTIGSDEGTTFTLAQLGLSNVDNFISVVAHNTVGSKTNERRISPLGMFWLSETQVRLRSVSNLSSSFRSITMEYTKTTD